jgi:dolichyl-phosphate-mannose-protein mannosyltransferase
MTTGRTYIITFAQGMSDWAVDDSHNGPRFFFSQREFFFQNPEHVPRVVYALHSCSTKPAHPTPLSRMKPTLENSARITSKREFYSNFHPRLGRTLVGLAGLLAGYDDSFEFKRSETYPILYHFFVMRIMRATFGVGSAGMVYCCRG